MSRLVLSGLLLGVVLSAACSSSPTTPTPVTVSGPLSGIWTGTLTRPGTSLSARLDLQDTAFGDAFIANGRYELRDATGAVTGAGTAGGILSGGRVSVTLVPTAPASCAASQLAAQGTVVATLTLEGSRLTGDAVVTLCGAEARGTLSLTK